MKRLPTIFLTLLLLLSLSAQAELKVSNAFGDHMVLQQQMPIRVWGWATAGQQVTVELAGKSAKATAGDNGKWLAELPAMKADGKALTLKINGDGGAIELTDILLGEVWICSGQSNMEWPLKNTLDGDAAVAAANHANIRLFNVPAHLKQNEPQDDAQKSAWQACSPESVVGFSAVGYYFGKKLSEEIDVPIGLVGTNWGGTRIEPWTPPVGFEQVEKVADWSTKNGASQIYNGMVAGLTPMSARGVIWYQGESNAGDGLTYDYLKEALVKGWRTTFKNDKLSFYWVQLANFGSGQKGTPDGGGWGPVREGQRRALRLPNTGMAVIIDIGDQKDIHPRNKQDVGQRLALWALAKDYGKSIVYSGPLYKSHKIEGNKVHLAFDHVGGGLMVGKKTGVEPAQEDKDAELGQFSLRDKDGNWHWAKATIEGQAVVVWSDEVKEPTAVRYAYDSFPKANLYNKDGLPASPFTTEE